MHPSIFYVQKCSPKTQLRAEKTFLVCKVSKVSIFYFTITKNPIFPPFSGPPWACGGPERQSE